MTPQRTPTTQKGFCVVRNPNLESSLGLGLCLCREFVCSHKIVKTKPPAKQPFHKHHYPQLTMKLISLLLAFAASVSSETTNNANRKLQTTFCPQWWMLHAKRVRELQLSGHRAIQPKVHPPTRRECHQCHY